MPAIPFQTEDDRWRAVLARDAAADGAFYYAVRTTGIYCRPGCPSRHPLRANVLFFATPEEAERQGFRACRRCRPEAVGVRQQAIARILHLLETREPAPTLPALGREVGLSPTHLQRMFKRATGLSPREYVAARRAGRLKEGLKNDDGVTTALYDAGYGSSRALYEAATDELGMTPGAYRRGGRGACIRYGFSDSPLGRFLVAVTDKGICSLHFGEEAEMLSELAREFPHSERRHEPTAVADHAQAIVAHLQGARPELELPLDVAATVFQRRVWEVLRRIPYGETRSYQEIAQLLGEPKAVRAVARACATNPVALVVPCHRV
ncbi:MAG TPA: bifunctional DNA-binding transcriptional regulator/O6-methylguanine-DNA methyltransferase Ada, partial [Oscillatoriaceae cyanobacterium]